MEEDGWTFGRSGDGYVALWSWRDTQWRPHDPDVVPTGGLSQHHALLAPGGRLFAVVGEGPVMNAMLVTRSADGEIWKEKLFETVLPPLDEAPQPSNFVF